MSSDSLGHRLSASLFAGAFLFATSCAPSTDTAVTSPNPSANPASATDPQTRLDAVLDETFARRLSLQEHAAWQILHGVLAFGREFSVERDGQPVSAVEHLLSGGAMQGWSLRPGIDLGNGRRGLVAVLDPGTKIGQGHPDQWLAYLTQCHLQPADELLVDGREYTVEDFIKQIQWDVPRNVDREYSWTLICLTTYLPTDARWPAQDGQEWSIEKLVELELEHDLSTSACGGSHRLIGLTTALNQHLSRAGKLEGVWRDVDAKVQAAIATARTYQNPDGSFSTNYFARPGTSPDLAQNLGATGHTLEFLTLAMTPEQLQQEWVQRAAIHLCDLLTAARGVSLECGALYHAAHGLVLYRERKFGPRTYGPLPATF